MTDINKVIITGVLADKLIRKNSITGVYHSKVVINHDSVQTIQGRKQKITCSIEVIFSGLIEKDIIALDLSQGDKVTVSGNLLTRKNKAGVKWLVLLANKINLINKKLEYNYGIL